MMRMTSLLLLSASFLLTGPVQAGNAEAGKALSDGCVDCHGASGNDEKDFPLAGMDPAAFVKAMKEYQSGVRTDSKKMTKSAKKLSDEEVADLAAYYATLPK